MPLTQEDAVALIKKVSTHLNGFVYQCERSPSGQYSMPFVGDNIKNIFQLDPSAVQDDATAMFEMTHPQDFERLKKSAAQSLKRMETWDCEWRITCPDGQEKWLQGSSTPEKKDNGNVMWTGYIKDITEFKRLQEVETMTQLAMHQQLNTIPDLLFDVDVKGRCHYIHSPGANGLIKQQYASFVNQHIRDFLPEPLSNALSTIFQSVSKKNIGTINRQIFVDLLTEKNWFDVSVTRSEQFEFTQLYVVLIRDITQQKQIEYQSRIDAVAYSTISEAMMVTDANRIILSINQAFEALTGFTQSDAVGKKARFYSGLNDENTIKRIRKALATHTEFKGVVQSYKKDGSIFYNQLSITPVFDEDNNLMNFIGFSRDVTEILDLRDAAEQSRQFLLTVIDAVPSRIFWKDKYSNYIGCNRAFAQDVGLENPKDIYFKTDYDLWPQPFAENYRQGDLSIIESAEDRLFNEEEGVNLAGEQEWTVKSKVLLRNEKAEIVGLLGVYDVVTDKKMAQKKLLETQRKFRESNEKYMDLYEFAPIGYMTIDQGGMVIEANWKARAMMGVKRKDLGSIRFNSFVIPEDRKIWQAELSSLLSQTPGSELAFELSILSSKDSTIHLNLSCVRSEGDMDSPFIRITMIDISDKKLSESRLREQQQYQQSLLDNVPYMVWLKDELGRFLTANKAFLNAARVESVGDILGKNDLDLWSKDLAQTYMKQDALVIEQMKPASNNELIEVDGTRKWFETYKSPVVVNHKAVGTVGFSVDVSDLKRSVLYEQFKSNMLELVVQENDLSKIFDSITSGVEKLNSEIFCIIALVGQDKKSVNIVSSPSLPSYIYDSFNQIKVALGSGTIGSAIFTKSRVIVSDVATHPYWINNRILAEKAGIAASWAEPILGQGGEVYGAFGMYIGRPVAPSAHDLVLIEQAAKLVSIAIERHESMSKIETLAYYDNVTNLPNRRYFIEHIARLQKDSQGESHYNVMVYLDLDAFKMINDARGTVVGDLLLVGVAKRLQKIAGENSTVARMGNDEYVLLISNLAETLSSANKKAESLAKRILNAMSKTFTIKKEKHRVGASVGVIVFSYNQNVEMNQIIKQSEIAMNQAKKTGGNAYAFFNSEMLSSITEKVSLEQDLRYALKHNQLQLYYQIQTDQSGVPFGAEALIRWMHPEKGMINPTEFIALAEESGLILSIGRWVLETACQQLQNWQQNSLTRHLTLSINISAVEFMQHDFVDNVKKCIESYQIDAVSLRFELTESMLVGNVEETANMMNTLGELGIQFSLDDFGTGYSSLQYLKRLPLYQLKIDRSFVKDIEQDNHDRTIIRTIIAMAQSMYINVIAEGVETEGQKALLLANGCKRYQGYLFGKPLPIEQLQPILESTQF